VTLNGLNLLGEIRANQVVHCQGATCLRARFTAGDGWVENGAATAGKIGEMLEIMVPPLKLKLGTQKLEVSLNDQMDWVGGSFLQIFPVPAVTSILPCAGPVSGGTVITLQGANFYKAEGVVPLCSFGGVTTQATLSECATGDSGVLVCTKAVCPSPAGNMSGEMDINTDLSTSQDAQGAYKVTVSLVLNSVQPNLVSSFVYYNVPHMSSLRPSVCPNNGKSVVTITGVDLTGGYNGSRFCRFIPIDASNHEMLFLDPQSTATDATPPLPMIATAYYTRRGTQIVCQCPSNPRVLQQPVRLVVSLNGQQYEGVGLAAAVTAPIILHSTTPLSGDVQGFSIVYATGVNFINGPGLQMIFGTQSVPATLVREGIIKAFSPQSPGQELGLILISVTNNEGVQVSPTFTEWEYFSGGLGCPIEQTSQKTCHWRGLEYGKCVSNECECSIGYWGRACSLVPATASVFPLTGVPAGGTQVSVRGLFLGGECCSLDAEHASVPFPVNPQPDSMLKVRTSNLVLGATYETFNDALQFSSPDYPSGSSINLEVSFDGGNRYIAAPNSFRFEDGPIALSFNPTTSPLGGDTIITIRGERFWDNLALSCKFEDAGETRALWVSTSMIKCATSPLFVRPSRSATPDDVMICAGHNSVSNFPLFLLLALFTSYTFLLPMMQILNLYPPLFVL